MLRFEMLKNSSKNRLCFLMDEMTDRCSVVCMN